MIFLTKFSCAAIHKIDASNFRYTFIGTISFHFLFRHDTHQQRESQRCRLHTGFIRLTAEKWLMENTIEPLKTSLEVNEI